jgi:O-antigen/teichoic acid export membrane protein
LETKLANFLEKAQASLTMSAKSLVISLKTNLNIKTLSRLLNDENPSKKASLNALASALDYGARLVVGFLINPFLLAGLGDTGYGIWQFLGRLIGYISPATGRPTQALKWTIAKQQASTDYQEKRRQVGNTISVWLLFLPVLALLGGLLVWFTPVLLDTPATLSSSVRLAAALLVANLIMVSLVQIPRSVLEGENLGYKRMGLSTTLVFIGGGLIVLALYLNTGLVGVASASLASTLLAGLLFLQVVRVYVPWFGIAKTSFAEIRPFLGLSGWFLLWNLVMKLMLASDVIVLGIVDSIEMVTDYTLNKYVPETVVSIVALVILGIMPGLGKIIGVGDLSRAARIRGEIMAISWLILTVFGATILLWNRSFIRLWVGAEYYGGLLPNLLITLMITQLVLIRNDAFLIDLTLDLRNKVLIGLFSATLALVFASILVGYFEMGIVGLCLGFITGRTILSLGYPLLVGRYLNIPVSSQFISVIRPAFVTSLLFGFVLTLQAFLTVDTWLGLIISVCLTLAVITPVAFLTGLSGDQRNQIWQRGRQVLRSRV